MAVTISDAKIIAISLVDNPGCVAEADLGRPSKHHTPVLLAARNMSIHP
jgi:hypothetical protein